MDQCEPDAHHVDDIVGFNESIDQPVAESIRFFSGRIDLARNLFLGMLGHDMRSPLQTVQITASYLAALNACENVSGAASRLSRSDACMQDGYSTDAATFGIIPRKPIPEGVKVFDTMNVRAETVGEKRSYSGAWKKQQTYLIPCYTFFDPNYETGKPVRWKTCLEGGTPLAIAGL